MLLYSADMVMLTNMVGDYENGIYSAAYKLISVISLFYGVYSAVVFPVMSRFFKNEKELFGLAQMYVTLEEEYKKAAEYNLYELDEIKEGLENVRDILFQKGYDVDKFIYYQQLYRTMNIKEYFEFVKTLE